MTVRNTTTSALNGWTVGLTLPGGHRVDQTWGGVAAGSGGAVSVRNAPYNGSVGVGASTTFGFVASGSGTAAVGSLTCTSP